MTHSDKSATEKLFDLRKKRIQRKQSEKHIIDQLYDAIYKFEGLGFVDPNFLCNVTPFKTIEDHVWHFEKGRLLILNPLVTSLFEQLSLTNDDIILSDNLIRETKRLKVVEAKEKIHYIFRRLHNCMIKYVCAPLDLNSLKKRALKSIGFSLRHFHHIQDKELIILPTKGAEIDKCECVNCLLRSFDFIHFIKKLKDAEQRQTMDSLELAYGNYLISTDNYRKAYFQYKNTDINTKGKEDKKIQYFISKINQIYLYNLISTDSDDPQEKEILSDIKSIDLDRSIHNELDIYVDGDVRNYLIEVKENKIFIKIKEFVTAELDKLEKSQGTNGNIHEIDTKYRFLYSHFHNNRIVYDAFSEFTQLVTKIFKSFVLCYTSSEKILPNFPEFYLAEAIIYVSSQELQNILRNIDLTVDSSAQGELVSKAEKLLNSFAREGFMGFDMTEPLLVAQLSNYRFQDNFTSIFSNMFTVLSKIDLHTDHVAILARPILSFVKTENILSWTDLKELGLFIEKHGAIFKPFQVLELFNHAINNSSYGEHKYHSLIRSLCKAYRKFYPDRVLEDKSLVHRAIANSMDSNGKADPKHLIFLYHIVDDDGKVRLLRELNAYLTNNFNDFLLIEMLALDIVTLDETYLPIYLRSVNQSKGQGFGGIANGKADFKNVIMINLIYQLYAYNICLNEEQLSILENLCPFEAWAVNPMGFDYNSFEVDWLIAVDQDFILEKLAGKNEIRISLEKQLQIEFEPTLAKIYFKYFLG
ncbi:hypothetical protein CPT03_03315 [Pedobacter ginsengisoli]|uniref:Uncharacterized protein n=1 Tax=Pedobacter ginsengisoli TaxID=363852 RepID=A0A2D1U1S6_9SPHI|nr:hypothetical protein [Pedobacter ginsengisoli]ATP55560.1 hypothetical protein CPT03_03315 [Pedobacter ginsengisoli]